MRGAAFAIWLALPAVCQGAEIETLWANGPWPACDIEIEFLSACCGIDRNAYGRVARYVERSGAVQRALSRPWGAAGETTLCLVIGSQAAGKAVFEDLTILVPARGRRLPRLPPPPPVVLRLGGR